MDFKTFVTERLAAITAQLNAIGANAKKTEELPIQTTLDPASLIRVSHGGISKSIDIQKVINSIKNNTFNQLLSIGEITLVGNVVTVPINASWKINEVIYNSTIDSIITIPYASLGLTRTDILVANTSGQIVLVQGVETSGIAARPNIPIDTVLVTEMVVTNDLVGNPTYPEIIDNYVLKVEGYSLTKNDLTDILKGYYDSAVAWITTNGSNLLAHLTDTNNPHSVTKSQVGLSNVDNTSDIDKPVSTAQASADTSTLSSANTYSDTLISQLINGAPADANTLKELNDKIIAVQAIIGGSSADGDLIVNTVSELLAVFATFPEGVDLVTLLGGKVNVTDIYNALDCIIAGKVLDARQGKVLNDAITAINVSLALKANDSDVVHLTGAETITGLKTFNSTLTASSFVKSGGTSVQFLKADGSIDSNTYLTSAVTSFSGGTTGLLPNVATLGAIVLSGTLVLANGGTGATTASGARTNLGATTIGSNLFTSTNPSAVTFLRANADNTVSWLDAVSFRTAIGAGTSTVTPSALTKTDDTNVTLTLGGTPATALLQGVSLTLGWTGTLSDGRIASASTWNSKQAGHANLTSLSALSYASTSFVKMTAAGTFTLDTNTYLNTISGITAGGELSGTYPNPTVLNSAVIGKVLTGVNVTGGSISATDSILTAFGKLQNQINGLIGGSIYQSTWNASTNTPALTTSVGTKGYYYIVSVAGATNLNGITDWKVGDWAIYDGSAWQKVDNTDAVSSVNGFTGAVSLTTANVSENTNLYFTDARARGAVSLTVTGNSGASTYSSATGIFNIPTYTLAGLGGQPLDADLTAIAGLTGTTGLLRKTALDTWTLDTTAYTTNLGTVTSVVAGTGLSGGTITGSGTISLASAYGDTTNPYASKTANTFLAAPNGAAGVPTFRAIVAADIPTLNQSTTGSAATLTTARTITIGSTGKTFNGSANVSWTLAEIGAYASSNPSGYISSPGYGLGDSPIVNTDANLNTLTSFKYFVSGANTPETYFQELTLGTSNGDFAQLGIGANNNMYFRWGTSSWKTLLNSSNYNSYSPTLTGTGALGTWGISISGNANTATSATTANNVLSTGGGYITSSTQGTAYSTCIQVREKNNGGAQASAMTAAPRLAFHWSGVVASSIAMEPGGRIAIMDNPGTGYENFVAKDISASSSFNGPGTGLTGTAASLSIGGTATYASNIAANPNRTDVAAYQVLWGNGNANSPAYSCAAVTIQSSTGTLQATTLRATADVIAYYSSDRRFKDNITPISNAIDKVKQIGGYEFDWNEVQQTHTGHDIGVIAQEIEAVFPDIVANREDGYKSVKYERLIPVLIEAIKEQQVQIEELRTLIQK